MQPTSGFNCGFFITFGVKVLGFVLDNRTDVFKVSFSILPKKCVLASTENTLDQGSSEIGVVLKSAHIFHQEVDLDCNCLGNRVTYHKKAVNSSVKRCCGKAYKEY